MQQHISETSQQRADRLLAAYQLARNARRAGRMALELSGDPLPEPGRWHRIRRALRPWVAGFDNPYVDAIGVAFALFFTVLLTVLAAWQWADHRAPLTSTIAPPVEVTPSPVADSPVGGRANGEAR